MYTRYPSPNPPLRTKTEPSWSNKATNAAKQISWEGFPHHSLSNQGNNINILASTIARAQTIHYLTGVHQTRHTALSELCNATSLTHHLLNNKYVLISVGFFLQFALMQILVVADTLSLTNEQTLFNSELKKLQTEQVISL